MATVAVPIPPGKVVGAQFLIRHAVAHNAVRDFEHLMADRHDRFLVPPMAFHAVIPRLQRGPLL